MRVIKHIYTLRSRVCDPNWLSWPKPSSNTLSCCSALPPCSAQPADTHSELRWWRLPPAPSGPLLPLLVPAALQERLLKVSRLSEVLELLFRSCALLKCLSHPYEFQIHKSIFFFFGPHLVCHTFLDIEARPVERLKMAYCISSFQIYLFLCRQY